MRRDTIIKRIAMGLCIVMLAGTLSACGAGGNVASSASDVKILFLMSSGGDTFRESLTQAVLDSGEENGVTVDLEYADDNVETQVAQMEAAEAAGYNVVICRLVDADTALQIERAAGDLPVIFINNCPDESYLQADQYMYVGSDEVVSGTYQAEYILDHTTDKQELNVVIMKGESGHSATKTRTAVVKQVLEDSGKTINYVFEDFADWDTELARQYFDIFLETGGTADCVICNNDSMALGVVESCKENGIDPAEQLIVGIDAIADGCQSIADGEMAFTVCQSAPNQAAAAVETAMLLGSGQSVKKLDNTSDDGLDVWVDFEKVDSSNVADYQ